MIGVKAVRKIDLCELQTMAEQAKEQLDSIASQVDRPVKVYIHWTAGHYDQFFNDYHVNVGRDGSLYTGTADFSEYKLHTYHRNSGAVSIAAACAFNAYSTKDLGPEPPTEFQIEAIAQALVILAHSLGIPIDKEHILTHAEAADNVDGDDRWHEPYGPASTSERWDFWVIQEGDDPGSGGDILRGKALWYKYNGNLVAESE